MIRYAPELAPLTRDTRDEVTRVLRSAGFGRIPAMVTQIGIVIEVVSMPRRFWVTFEASDQSGFGFLVDGKREYGPDGRRIVRRDEDEPNDERARTRLDDIAWTLRKNLSDAEAMLAALEAIPEHDREGWQELVVETLRDVIPELERIAYEVIDAPRGAVPGEGP